MPGPVRERGQEIVPQRVVGRLDLRLLSLLAAPYADGRAVSLRVCYPCVVKALSSRPVNTGLEFAQSIEGVHEIVQDAACKPDIVDDFLVFEEQGEFEDPEAALDTPEEALHILSHTLQPLAQDVIFLFMRGFRGVHEDPPLSSLIHKGQ